METNDKADQHRKVSKFFLDHTLTEVADIICGEFPEGTDRHALLSQGIDRLTLAKEFAQRVKAHIPPRTDRETFRGWGGEPICGIRTAFYAKSLEEYLNNTIRDDKGFCEYVRTRYHRTIQSYLVNFAIRIIRYFATFTDKDIDARNEYAVSQAKRIARALDSTDGDE